MTDPREQAFINGYEARGEGKGIDENPYLLGTPEHRDWACGYDDADGQLEYYGDDMDGDHDSAMASCGWGTDEDYGYYGGDE